MMKSAKWTGLVILAVLWLSGCVTNGDCDECGEHWQALESAVAATPAEDLVVSSNKPEYVLAERILFDLTLDRARSGYLTVLVVDGNDAVQLLLPSQMDTANGPMGLGKAQPLDQFLSLPLVATEPTGNNLVVAVVTATPFNLYFRHCVHPEEPAVGCSEEGLLTLDDAQVKEVIEKIGQDDSVAGYVAVKVRSSGDQV